MLLSIALILCGYYGIAALRSAIKPPALEDDSEIEAWARRHPYHYFFKGWAENSGDAAAPWAFFGGLLALASWIAPLVILLQPNFVNLALWPYLIGGIGLYFLVALTYRLYSQGIFAECQNQVQKLWQKAKNWWQSRIPAEIQEAKSIWAELQKIPKGKKDKKLLQPLLSKVEKVIKAELPHLLQSREQLNEFINICKATICQEKQNGIIPGEERLMAESEEELQKLQERLLEVKNKIQYILTSLDHLKVRFCALIGLESDHEFQQEIEQVHNELDIMLKSREEADRFFTDSSTPIPFTAKPTEKIMEEVAECLHGDTSKKVLA